MANRLKPNASDEPDRQHNMEARSGTIQSVFRELSAIDNEAKKINQRRSELLNTKIKGDLGMKIGDFRAAYRLYQLEDDDRDEMLDTLKECFGALGKGEQLDFLKAAERKQAREASVGQSEAA